MKKIVRLLTLIAVSVALYSCQEQEVFEGAMNEDIVLDLSKGTTRAEDTEVERFVDHIDVFVFSDEEGKPKAHYERRQLNNARQFTLNAKRSSFTVNGGYYVYLIANSNISEETFAAIDEYSELLITKQEDLMLHLSGLSLENVPKYFLMDAVAKDASGNSSVKLNNGNVADNTVLKAELRRAAAKVQVNITADTNVKFKSFSMADGSEGGLYYIRNLAYDAFLLAEAKADNELDNVYVRTTAKTNSDEYFTWNPRTDNKSVKLTVYAYPNHWENTSILERETCIVVNLPMSYDDGTTVTDYPNSWFKIPMTNDYTIRRNHYYEVNITLNRPGATSESTPVDVEDVHYAVKDWEEQTINVGGEDKPKYLMVNHTEMEMHNVDVDAATLEFASSSPVTVTVKDVYYYNKYGLKTAVNNAGISATTDGGIDGKITVRSGIPTNNTVRYFTLVVTNQQNLSKEVFVSQYPLVYITNIQSYYSYRSDFINGRLDDGTATADLFGNRGSYTRFGVNYRRGTHSYVNNSNTADVFFRSKYVNSIKANGLSDVDTYSQYRTSDLDDSYNARMYHVRITASSSDYTLGRPKITNGVTDPGEDNARMVSPSFMIASQLGTVLASTILDQDRKDAYTEHAKQYVEVYEDAAGNLIHLSDWRLPTAAELEIIYKYQGTSNDPANADAIDFLLGGEYYYSASGQVKNPKPSSNSSGVFIRCIRDVYEVEE